jgi:hypothetical protein
LFIIGLVLVCGINADTINIVDTLWLNPSVRESVVKAATETVEQGDETASTSTTVASAIDQLEELQLPLGWAPESAENDPRRLPGEFSDWFAKLVGLVLTAVALTFGSSFWFDLLKQFVGVRSSGAPPSAPPSSGSKPEGA